MTNLSAVSDPAVATFDGGFLGESKGDEIPREQTGAGGAATEAENRNPVAAAVIPEKFTVGGVADMLFHRGERALGLLIDEIVFIVVSDSAKVVRDLAGTVLGERGVRSDDIGDNGRISFGRIVAADPKLAGGIPREIRGIHPGFVVPRPVEKKNVMTAARVVFPIRIAGEIRAFEVVRFAAGGLIRRRHGSPQLSWIERKGRVPFRWR